MRFKKKAVTCFQNAIGPYIIHDLEISPIKICQGNKFAKMYKNEENGTRKNQDIQCCTGLKKKESGVAHITPGTSHVYIRYTY